MSGVTVRENRVTKSEWIEKHYSDAEILDDFPEEGETLVNALLMRAQAAEAKVADLDSQLAEANEGWGIASAYGEEWYAKAIKLRRLIGKYISAKEKGVLDEHEAMRQFKQAIEEAEYGFAGLLPARRPVSSVTRELICATCRVMTRPHGPHRGAHVSVYDRM